MYWLIHFMAWDSVADDFYAFWSGSGGVFVGVILTWLGLLTALWWGTSCRRAWWCPMVGRHDWEDPESGAVRKLCWVHHPRVESKYVSGNALKTLQKECHLYLGKKPGRG